MDRPAEFFTCAACAETRADVALDRYGVPVCPRCLVDIERFRRELEARGPEALEDLLAPVADPALRILGTIGGLAIMAETDPDAAAELERVLERLDAIPDDDEGEGDGEEGGDDVRP